MRAERRCPLFRQGACVRRWSAANGQALCDEGKPLPCESGDAAAALIASVATLPGPFATSPDEARTFAVWEEFAGASFQQLVQAEEPRFRFFL